METIKKIIKDQRRLLKKQNDYLKITEKHLKPLKVGNFSFSVICRKKLRKESFGKSGCLESVKMPAYLRILKNLKLTQDNM